MPPTRNTYLPALGIDLGALNDHSFLGRETITGSVIRTASLVSPDASLEIRIMGRAKAHISKHNGNSTVKFKSRFDFFETCPGQTHHVLHRGPVHIGMDPSETQTWPFSITIPHDTGINLDMPDRYRRASLMPLELDAVRQHGLPATFADAELGYMEYYLEASLRYEHNSKTDGMTSTRPIRIRPQPALSSNYDWKLQSTQWRHTINSYLLMPGRAPGPLSFKQKSKQFFGASSTPQHFHSIELGVPTCIQFDHAGRIPIMFRITPVLQHTSSILHGVPQTVVLNWMKMSLKYKTTASAPRETFEMGDKTFTSDTSDRVDLGLEHAFELLPEPIVIVAEENVEPVDIGAALDCG